MSTVTVTTLTQVDFASSANKFYRTLVIDNWEIRNWGPMEIRGQASVKRHPDARSARASAEAQLELKWKKGYKTTDRVVDTFEFPVNKLIERPNPDGAKLLIDAYKASGMPGSNPVALVAQRNPVSIHPTAPTPAATTDRLEVFNQRTLAAITVSMTDPGKATEEYIRLNDELKALMDGLEVGKSYLDTLSAMVTA